MKNNKKLMKDNEESKKEKKEMKIYFDKIVIHNICRRRETDKIIKHFIVLDRAAYE